MACTASIPLLVFKEVSRFFTSRQGVFGKVRGEVRAVDSLSLEVRRGETLGLVGESGCGKSTLARMAVRLLPPSTGDILFDGESLVHPVPEAQKGLSSRLSRRLQMIFQDPFSSLNPRLRIGTSISEPLATAGMPKEERKERVGEMLRLVGLQPDHASRYPHEFSGGQRQRIAIARALITHPELVVCDEAVSALDASVQAQVLNLLKEAREVFGLTYLFISHDLAVVGFMSDRVAVMYLGRIVEQAEREALFNQAAHPYTRALLASAPVHDPERRFSRPFLQGEMPSPFAPPAGCAFHPRCPQVMPCCREQEPIFQELAHAPGHWVRCHLYRQDVLGSVSAASQMQPPKENFPSGENMDQRA